MTENLVTRNCEPGPFRFYHNTLTHQTTLPCKNLTDDRETIYPFFLFRLYFSPFWKFSTCITTYIWQLIIQFLTFLEVFIKFLIASFKCKNVCRTWIWLEITCILAVAKLIFIAVELMINPRYPICWASRSCDFLDSTLEQHLWSNPTVSTTAALHWINEYLKMKELPK